MDRPIKKSRFPLKWIASMGILAIAISVFVYQIRQSDQSPVIYATKEDLRVVEAQQERFQEYINIIGRVVSSRTSYIDTLESGTVKKLLATEGDILSEGQTLLILENNQLETSLLLKQSQIREKKIALGMDQLNCQQKRLVMQREKLDMTYQINRLTKEYRQSKEMFTATRAISKNDYEAIADRYHYWLSKRDLLNQQHRIHEEMMQNEMDQSRIGLDILKTEKARLEKRIANLIVKVATAGLLTKLDASVGEIKTTGSRIAQFDVIQPLKIEAEIDEYYLNKVKINFEGNFDFEIPKWGKRTFNVVITMIHPEVQNNMFTVDLNFKDSPETSFIIGQTFDIELALGKPVEAIVIKKGPFLQDTGGNWVYVIDPTETLATKRRIKPGRQNPDYLEVLEGLEPGEKIIISRYETYENLPELKID